MTLLAIPMSVVAQSDSPMLTLKRGPRGGITYAMGLTGPDCPVSGIFDLQLVSWYPQYRLLTDYGGQLRLVSGCTLVAYGTLDITHQLPYCGDCSYAIYGILTITYNTFNRQGIVVSPPPSPEQKLTVNGWP